MKNPSVKTWPGAARLISGEEENRTMHEALKELEERGKTHLQRFAARTIKPSLVYMLSHLDEPLRVTELSRIADVSCSHFFALFKRATGETPISYFTRARLRRACTLLRETSLSVKEVAAALGYEDEFYFSRLFKSVHHLAPSYYRAQCGFSHGQVSPIACAPDSEEKILLRQGPQMAGSQERIVALLPSQGRFE